LQTTVDCKKEFGNEVVVESDVIAEGFFVAPNDYQKLTQACRANTLLSEKDLAGCGKYLELSAHAVEVTWYVH
jgi:hypothetical protein